MSPALKWSVQSQQKRMEKIYSESESESDFSNFVINSLSSNSKSESGFDDSESDFNSVFINFDVCGFLPYIYTLLNKLVDDFF